MESRAPWEHSSSAWCSSRPFWPVQLLCPLQRFNRLPGPYIKPTDVFKLMPKNPTPAGCGSCVRVFADIAIFFRSIAHKARYSRGIGNTRVRGCRKHFFSFPLSSPRTPPSSKPVCMDPMSTRFFSCVCPRSKGLRRFAYLSSGCKGRAQAENIGGARGEEQTSTRGNIAAHVRWTVK